MSLVKVDLDEKAKEALSPLAKQNNTLDKYTGDSGDLKIFATADGAKKYVRVWETVMPQKEGGPAKYVKTFYEIVGPAAPTAATPIADIK